MNTFSLRLKRLAWLSHVLAYSLGGGLAMVLGLAAIGFPDFLTRWILAGANSGDYFIQAHKVYLDLAGGLIVRDVSVFRKGLPGPPFLEARECRVLYHLFERPKAGHERIKEVRVYDGVLRPLWSKTSFGPGKMAGLRAGFASEKHAYGAAKHVDLDVALYNFDVLGTWVEQVKTTVQVNDAGVYLSRLSGKIGRELHSGAIDGTLAWRYDGKLTGRLSSSFDPRALIPTCKFYFPDAVGVLDQFSFPATPPRLDLTFEAVTQPALSVLAKGRIQAANYAYRGAVIGFASMNVEVIVGNGTNRMRLDPFTMTMGGRHVRGQVDFDLISGIAEFQASSEVNLAAILRLAGLKEALMEPWVFEEGSRLVAKGRVGYTHPEISEVEARVEGTKIGYKGISFSNYSFAYQNRGLTHTFSDIRGNMGGGFAGGSAVLTTDKTGAHWVADVKAEIINADADEFLKLVSTNLGWRMGGKIFGNLEVDGIGANLAGQGQFTIRDARIFRSPLGTGLLEKLGILARDLDLPDIPAEARFSFNLHQNKIVSQDLIFEAGSFGLAAKGSYGLDGSLDWIIKPGLTKKNNAIGRTVFSWIPPSRQGGYALTGTIGKPEWRPISNQ